MRMNKPAKPLENSEDTPLFADHKKVYPKSISGTFRRLKWLVLITLLFIYFFTPFLRWDRGPEMASQAVLFDFSGGRFYFFDAEIWPQQIYYIMILLIFSALALFLSTALFGRIWCGYACPQTVWSDLFMLVERWIEGERGERIRRDIGPTTRAKVLLKLAKHAVWLVISLLTGGWFIAYFYDVPTLAHDIMAAQLSSSTLVMIGILTLITYFLAGYVREHVCTFMCPWPRFQAAMQDEESLVITYRRWRGENRSPLHKSVAWPERRAAGFGDCIDCGACQQVCPTGIDIRNGSQLQCIGCALCIDACNEIMTKIGRERGLIAFDTDNNQIACSTGLPPRFRLLRGRTATYALLMLALIVASTIAYERRPQVQVNVLRDRAPLFVRLSSGEILNGYTLKILNMTRNAREYQLTLSGIAGTTMTMAGGAATPSTLLRLNADADTVATFRVMVRAPRASLTGFSTPLQFTVTPQVEGDGDRYEAVFLGP
ncbi:MAG: cytochrome c oxidase accessory protein CcoG [Rhodospirillaceae bacterium]